MTASISKGFLGAGYLETIDRRKKREAAGKTCLPPFVQAQQGASLNLTARIPLEMDGVSLLMHQGDISYARGSVAQWDTFFDQYQAMLGYAPYMTLPGNHERDCPASGDRFYPYVSAGDSGTPRSSNFILRRFDPERSSSLNVLDFNVQCMRCQPHLSTLQAHNMIWLAPLVLVQIPCQIWIYRR